MLIIDASVWVSAADAADGFSAASRTFLSTIVEDGLPITIPDLCELEVACALARRMDAHGAGRALAERISRLPLVLIQPFDPPLLRRAIELGTEKRLRAGDAVYVAVAERAGGRLIAWDEELVRRAGATTPRSWLENGRDE